MRVLSCPIALCSMWISNLSVSSYIYKYWCKKFVIIVSKVIISLRFIVQWLVNTRLVKLLAKLANRLCILGDSQNVPQTPGVSAHRDLPRKATTFASLSEPGAEQNAAQTSISSRRFSRRSVRR